MSFAWFGPYGLEVITRFTGTTALTPTEYARQLDGNPDISFTIDSGINSINCFLNVGFKHFVRYMLCSNTPTKINIQIKSLQYQDCHD